MVETRRSTRQTVASAPKYNDESSPEPEKPASKRNAKKTTRQKRVREEDSDKRYGPQLVRIINKANQLVE